MKDLKENKSTPLLERKWVPGAEPLALCMSCDATFPLDITVCPKCGVGLSVVRKCPSCGRIQAAQHVVCIYCANSFMLESGLGLSDETFEEPLHEYALRPIIALLGALVILSATIAIFLYLRRKGVFEPAPPPGQSYVLVDTSLRQKASHDSPPVKDLKPSEILDIEDFTVDAAGHRWFQASSEGITGYVLIEDVAPPKTAHPEKGYALLRHSLLGLEDPALVQEATLAVEYYRRRFPGSPHGDELIWLLAERARSLAGGASERESLLGRARELYAKLAGGNSEFAESARLALAQLPTGRQGNRTQPSPERSPMRLSIIGGEPGPSQPAGAGSLDQPIRSITVVSRTPLVVLLKSAVEISPGVVFRGEIDREIRVNNQTAVPQGSVVRLAIREAGTGGADTVISPAFVRMSDMVIAGQTFSVSAEALRFELPVSSERLSAPSDAGPQLPAGTRIIFRLREPLVLPRR